MSNKCHLASYCNKVDTNYALGNRLVHIKIIFFGSNDDKLTTMLYS
jgi:hypothetical protein